MTAEISNTDDIIDSRDVIERLAELREELKNDASGEVLFSEDPNERAILRDEARAALDSLVNLAEQGETFADWEHGEALIRDSYFEDYAAELAEDIGAISPDAGWPAHCIDWERAARELRMDYTSVEFDGVTYWGRS